MKNLITCTIATLLLLVLAAAPAVHAGQAPVQPGISLEKDLQNDGLEFESFRSCRDNFRNPTNPPPSRQGLSTLPMSGSSEFSKEGLKKIKKMIPLRNIVVVDMREESHGFIDGRPVSWKNDHNDANKGKTLEEIMKLEETLLWEARERDPAIKTVCTEEVLCRELGAGYARFPVTDHSGPTDALVERFVSYVKSLPPKTWMHFHCKAGMGRTTTFMAMYDMMRNARDASCDDIIARQHLLGGLDLSGKATKGTAWFDVLARERDSFIRVFYEYCRKSDAAFSTPWSHWQKQ